jgi:RNA polymerase sigma-70 factor (ECF subfamily)
MGVPALQFGACARNVASRRKFAVSHASIGSEPMRSAQAIEDDAALAECARAGDAGAFAELARRYRPALVALAFDRTRNLDDAHDLAQEALVRALERIGELREAASFPTWLRAIAANLCASWTRRPAMSPLAACAADDADIAAEAIERCEQREIARALAALPAANRLALLMHVWDGVPYERIAAFLGVPVTTVEGRIFRARQSLRHSLVGKITSVRQRDQKGSKE